MLKDGKIFDRETKRFKLPMPTHLLITSIFAIAGRIVCALRVTSNGACYVFCVS